MKMIPPEMQAEILALHYGQKFGTRKIAKQLGIDRKTARRVIGKRKVNLRPEGSVVPRASILDPFKSKVDEMLKRDPKISSARILQQIRLDGFLGGRYVVQTYVSKVRSVPHRSREAFLRLMFEPGETAQVDWGEFGTPFNDGIKVHCFLMVLCHSRLMYIEFTRSEKFEEFIRCHENAFKFFGNRVPMEIWYDNLRSAVTERMGSLIRFNARFLAYMGHHGVRPHACNPARGNEKGRVERGVRYVRDSFWMGRQFKDFKDLCVQANAWLNEFANHREHYSTRKIPALQFESVEKRLLRPMNDHPYDTREVLSRVVPPNFMITYETNRYSVPWTLVGLTVTVKVNDECLEIYYHDRRIAMHIRSYEKNRFYESHEHFKGLLARKPGATKESWQIAAVKNIGPSMSEYLKLVRFGHRSLRNEVSKILALATIYGDQYVNLACADLLKSGVIGVENLELALKTKHHPSEYELQPAPLQFQNAKLNRTVPTVDLRRYDALLFTSAVHGQDVSMDEHNIASIKEDESNANNNGNRELDGAGNGDASKQSDEF